MLLEAREVQCLVKGSNLRNKIWVDSLHLSIHFLYGTMEQDLMTTETAIILRERNRERKAAKVSRGYEGKSEDTKEAQEDVTESHY